MSLEAVLADAREAGLLGPGPVAGHLGHAQGFAAAWESWRPAPPASVADLGSGAGIPGLALALAWPAARVTLVERSARRAAWLRDAVAALSLGTRVVVAEAEAEVYGARARATVDLVTARGFGPPAPTAECAAPLLVAGGLLVVSDPPGGDPARWDDGGLAQLGLERRAVHPGPPAIAVLERTGDVPERYPRKAYRRRPLW